MARPAQPRPPEPQPGAPPPDVPEPEPEPEPQESPEPEPSPGPEPPPPDPDLQPEDEPAPEGEDASDPAADPGAGEGMGECGLVEVSCHVTGWFADFVTGALNPLFGWMAGVAFHVPQPSEGVEGLWSGVLAVVNILFVLLVMTGGVILMGRESFQTRYGAGEMLGRAVFAVIAANSSMWIAREIFRAANATAKAVGALGIDAAEAAENMRERMEWVLAEAAVFTVLLLVALVVMLVVWIIVDVVRIVMSMVLVIAAPLLLAFHALPQTNYLAALWWRSMAGLCAMPILQSLAFIAMMRLFFEGQYALLGHLDMPELNAPDRETAGGGGMVYDLVLFLVLVYIQIRIPFWVMKLVWSPHPGRSPIMGAAKVVAMMLLYRGLRAVKLPKGGELFSMGAQSRPPRGRVLTGRRAASLSTAAAEGGSARGAGTVEPLRPNVWWYRDRPARPAGDTATARRELPASGGAGSNGGDASGPQPRPPRPLGGPRPLNGPPPPRPHGTNPARTELGDGRFPRRPRTEQQPLFTPKPPSPQAGRPAPSPGPAAAPTSGPPLRRWRQGVLPTPPPQRVPGRRTVRLGDLLDARDPMPQRRVRGQLSLFVNPKKHWVQRGLPFSGLRRRK